MQLDEDYIRHLAKEFKTLLQQIEQLENKIKYAGKIYIPKAECHFCLGRGWREKGLFFPRLVKCWACNGSGNLN